MPRQLKDVCAPGMYDKENNTCFTDDMVLHMANAYNAYVQEKMPSMKPVHISNNKMQILKQLLERFDEVCHGDQVCLTKQDFMNSIIMNDHRQGSAAEAFRNRAFRPVLPNKPTEWLSTTDINNIMKQYENVYPDFLFAGAVPRDCTHLDFCSLNKLHYPTLYQKGIRRIGTVFNMDEYGKGGSHWVALYIDIAKGVVAYVDSAGSKPPREVVDHINKYKKFHSEKFGKEPQVKINTKRYQYDSSECSIYSCHFIIKSLEGRSLEDYVMDPLQFKEINACRNVYSLNKPVDITSSEYNNNKC